MLETLLWSARILISLVFALSSFSKVRSWPLAQIAVSDFGFPRSISAFILTIVIGLELAISITILIPIVSVFSAIVAAVLLIIFIFAIIFNLVRGNTPACGCFGSSSKEPISHRDIFRNLVFIALAIFIVFPHYVSNNLLPSPSEDQMVWLVIIPLAVATIANMTINIHILRRRGTEIVSSRMSNRKVQVKSQIEDFVSIDSNAKPVSSVLQWGESPRSILLFVSTSCQPCKELLRDLDANVVRKTHGAQTLIYCSGDFDVFRDLAEKYQTGNQVRFIGHNVLHDIGIESTPTGIRIDSSGHVQSRYASGKTDIIQLLESY